MKKQLLNVFAFLTICLGMTAQTVVTIGVGTASTTGVNYNPIYRSSAASAYDFSRAYYLYDQAELTAAGIPNGATITMIEWDKSNTGATVSTTAAVVFNILMKNSTATTYSTSSTWGALSSGATAVYGTTAQVIPATTGFMPFNLTTSFVYTGGALEILTDWDISAVAGNPTTAGFAFNTTAVANRVGGNSNSVALTGTTAMATYGNRPNIRITYTPPSPCSGTPNAGTVVASNTLLCTPQNVNLSLTGSTSASGLAYQWLSSPDGISWSAIPTATNISTTQSVTATTYYQCAVSCGTNVATSTTLTVNYGTTPNAGTTVASSTLACVGQSVSVNLTGASSTTGLTYQWQSSPNGSTWTSISSATTSVLTQTITGAIYYQAILGCALNTATSTPVQINLAGANVYATVPFIETFDNTWQNRCDNQNVPSASFWASNPTTGNNSWRRQDGGATSAWSFLPSGIVTPMGTGAANFHTYGSTSNTMGDLDLYVDMNSTSLNYEMSFYNINVSGNDTIQVWLSTNAGSTFTKKGQYLTAGSWTKQVINLGSVGSASCVVRFRGISDYGNDDMGIDSLKIYTAICSTPPVAGVITGTNSTTINSVNNYTISPSTGNVQWYTGTSATGPWTQVSGATSSTANITAAISGTMYITVIASAPGCTNDTANTAYPVTVLFPGDNVCDAIPLSMGTSAPYSPSGATAQAGEVMPVAGTCSSNINWCLASIENSMWFSFVAPASGYVTVNSPGFDTQLAVWQAASCSDLLSTSTATLIAANDDDADYATHGGVQYSSFVKATCLTPGATYYIQLDSYGAAAPTETTTIIITDMGTPFDASFTGLSANYCASANASLTPVNSGGVFTINTSTTAVTSFSTSTTGTYTVNYSIYACKSSSVTTVNAIPTITVSASSASVCAGSSATLTAGGATNYTWTSGGSTATEVVTPTVATVYTVTGETSGCSNTNTVSLGVNAIPSVSASASNTLICYNLGESSVLTVSTSATSYTWSNGANTMSTTVTPTVGTTYTVTVNDGNCDATATVFVDAQTCTGIKAITATSGINVYPNPSNGILNVAIASELSGNTSIEIYDAIGKLVITENLSSELTTINTSKLTEGVYMYKVINNNRTIKIGKVVKH